MKSKIIRATAANNSIRAFIANTTYLVDEARRLHKPTPAAMAALGRTLTATSILGLMLKSENHKITVRINGDGEVGPIVVVGNANGNVKGYISNPHVESKLREDGKLDVGHVVGKNGSISVIKDLGLKEPYVGTYPLVTGEIAEDFASYFMHSEQQPSAVALGVLIDLDHSIKAAGGFIIQVLPNIEEETLTRLENIIQSLPSMSTLIESGADEKQILNRVLGELDPQILQEYEVQFLCDCSQERLEQALISIGKKDIENIIKEDEKAELLCHFCNTKYNFDKDALQDILEKI